MKCLRADHTRFSMRTATGVKSRGRWVVVGGGMGGKAV